MNEISPSREEPESAPGQPPAEGPVYLGVYQVIGPMGKGGMGMVFRAWHTRLKRPVAIKTLPAERLDNPTCVLRFQREMEAIGKLDHPNLVRATDAGEERGIHFLVMELIEGADAAQLVRTCGMLPVADACEVVRQAALGLQHAHEHGLVHRDIKPSNLMVGLTGQVKVLDLGLALLRGNSEGSVELTASQHWMGTLDYMAPEQGQDAHRVDIRADVYSLGCTLYKLLAGQAPFAGSGYDTPYRKMDAHAHQPARPIRELTPQVSEQLAVVLERMLAKSPEDRFDTPKDVAAALTPFVAGSDLARLVRAERAVKVQPEGPAGETGSLARLTSTTPPRQPIATPVPADLGKVATPTPASIPVELPPRRLRKLMVAGLVATVLATGLTAVWLGWRRQEPDKEHPLAEVPKNQEAADTTPNVWHNLLERPPKQLLWPSKALAPVFEPRRQRLLVNCEGLGLLGLGSAPVGGYKLQVGLSQTRPTGGIGIFFGYREEGEGDNLVRRYQRLELVPLSRKGPASASQRFALSRTRTELRKAANLGWFPQDKRVAMNALPALSPHEHILTVEVSQHGSLVNVLWEGQPMNLLTTSQVNGSFHPGDSSGSFGVFTAWGTCVVTNARIMFFDKE